MVSRDMEDSKKTQILTPGGENYHGWDEKYTNGRDQQTGCWEDKTSEPEDSNADYTKWDRAKDDFR